MIRPDHEQRREADGVSEPTDLPAIIDPAPGHSWITASSAWAGSDGGRLYCVTCSQRRCQSGVRGPAQIAWAQECALQYGQRIPVATPAPSDQEATP
jgi:hypothetical protein